MRMRLLCLDCPRSYLVSIDSVGQIELTSGQDLNASVLMSINFIMDIICKSVSTTETVKVVVVSLPLSSGPRLSFRQDELGPQSNAMHSFALLSSYAHHFISLFWFVKTITIVQITSALVC